MRIAIATSGRFHVLDLARELTALGHDVRLYSMLPGSRVEKFGFRRQYHRSLLGYVAPLIAWERFAPGTLPELQNSLLSRALDRAVEVLLEPCDVLVCMSGIYLRAIRAAKRKYGASVWLERGSRHILSQAEILAAVGARGPTPEVIHRELDGYRLADRIVVPARQVAESFERDPAAYSKLFVNPYGTKLEMFRYREREQQGGRLRLVFAGAWSRRKGCDVLEKAVRAYGDAKLLHAGPIIDQAFPVETSQFAHVGAVQQSQLCKIYHDSDAFVHASREEGLSVVQAQALASGLPLICTERTGGEDLGHTPALRDRIIVVPHDDVDALRAAFEHLRGRLRQGPSFKPLTQADLKTLSWAAYGRRYSDELAATVAVGSVQVSLNAG